MSAKDGSACVRDVSSGKVMWLKTNQFSSLGSVCWSADGRSLLIAQSDGTAQVLQPITGAEQGAPIVQGALIRSARLSADGQLALTAGEDGQAKLWKVSTGKLAAPPFKHPARVRAVDFDPTCSRVVTGCDDSVARIWESKTGRLHELAKLKAAYENEKASFALTWDARGDERASVIRKLEGFSRVVCHREPIRRKLRLTLSSDAVDLGLIKAPGDIVVFASGQILELWQISTWRESTAIQDIRQFTEQVKDILGSETPE